MRDSGGKTNRMGEERRSGAAVFMRDCGLTATKMDTAKFTFKTAAISKKNSTLIRYTDRENITGRAVGAQQNE